MAITNYCHGFWFRQSWAGPRDSAACRIAISDSTDERTWTPWWGVPDAGGPAGSSPGTSLSLTTVLRPRLSFLYLGHAPRLPTVSGTLSLMLRARPTPPPPPVLHVPATTSPSQRGRVPLTSSNSVLSCQVRLGHTATFSLHGACHYLRSLWLVCPHPTYLVGSPGSRCSDGIAGIGEGCWGDTPTEEKGRKQVWAGGVIRTWLEKSLRPSGAPEQRRPTGVWVGIAQPLAHHLARSLSRGCPEKDVTLAGKQKRTLEMRVTGGCQPGVVLPARPRVPS